jgi:hypothetical protein
MGQLAHHTGGFKERLVRDTIENANIVNEQIPFAKQHFPVPFNSGRKSTQLSYLSKGKDTLIEKDSSKSRPVKYYLSKSLKYLV